MHNKNQHNSKSEDAYEGGPKEANFQCKKCGTIFNTEFKLNKYSC